MSYHSIHNESENASAICRWKCEPLTLVILESLAEDMIFGWHILLYGNTKFEDLAIVLAWFRCHWNVAAAAKMVGFCLDAEGRGTDVYTKRVEKVNSRNYMELVESCVNAGKLSWGDVTSSLNYEPKTGTLAFCHKLWGYRLCSDAVKIYGGKRAAIQLLGITLKRLNFWLEFGS